MKASIVWGSEVKIVVMKAASVSGNIPWGKVRNDRNHKYTLSTVEPTVLSASNSNVVSRMPVLEDTWVAVLVFSTL